MGFDSAAGGFFLKTLPSPPPSTIASASATLPVLPSPRAQPLKLGSTKESNFVEYVDRKLLEVSGRYENRHKIDSQADAKPNITSNGYKSFSELAIDLENLIDVIWVSGTPSLQTPYLLNVALATSSYMPSFDFAPHRTFQLLHKLDVCFSSLLHGQNVETDEVLPGFDGGRGRLTTTEKVRIRGLVERTRVAVVLVAGKNGSLDDVTRVTGTEGDEDLVTDTDTMEGLEGGADHGRWEMEIARVYERTIVDLGIFLDASSNNSYG
ncbi:hypothetical protein MMC13_005118 [Lambiella insularis]|nr:hypothetical protein [Lambiella insularis]